MAGTTIKAAVLVDQGEGDVIQYRSVALDEPGPDEVLVKVRATCHRRHRCWSIKGQDRGKCYPELFSWMRCL
jgi:NADPH:quinone reductase-like Zn-dependent oxidoreductase